MHHTAFDQLHSVFIDLGLKGDDATVAAIRGELFVEAARRGWDIDRVLFTPTAVHVRLRSNSAECVNLRAGAGARAVDVIKALPKR